MSTTVDDQCTNMVKFQAGSRRWGIMWYCSVRPVSNDGLETCASAIVLLFSVFIYHVCYGQFSELLSVFKLKHRK